MLWLGLVGLAFGLARRQTTQFGVMLWASLAAMTLFYGINELSHTALSTHRVVVNVPVSNVQVSEEVWARIWSQRPQVAVWRPQILEAAEVCDISPVLIAAVMSAESNGNANAVGAAGEIGLMQIMPFADRPLSRIRSEPAFNIKWGACLLRSKNPNVSIWDALKQYNGDGEQAARYADKVLAIYNSFTHDIAYEPMRGARLTKAYGVPVTYQRGGRHTGIDLSPGIDETIYAVADGVIKHVGPLYCNLPGKCRGPYSIVQHLPNGLYAIYSHNAQSYVKAGQAVRAGEPIAVVGNLGYSFGAHLHFELCAGCTWTGDWTTPFAKQRFIDPQPFLEGGF